MNGAEVASESLVGLHLNLHTHLEGWVRPSTAAELASAARLPEPEQGWARALRVGGPSDLPTFLSHVALVYPLLGDWSALERVTAEAVEDAAADGCRFLELRVGPVTHERPGLPLEGVMDALCTGLARGVEKTGMPAGLVPAILRHHPTDLNERLAELAVAHADRGVVGFDLAGDELNYPDLRPHARAFAIAREGGIGLTAHAAEAGEARDALDAHEHLGVKRIGHGTRVAEDPQVLAQAADLGLTFEVCPTSNVLTGAVRPGQTHPAAQFLRAGCDVVLGDDDPQQTGSPLSAERRIFIDELGLTGEQVMSASRAAVARAFCPEDVRSLLAAGFQAE